ncbi:COP9 signalosome complex subunit 4 [Aphelenchoides fujianensis]|nr:COP9 signalosome complex subunit 4 [Aphelenchoides fujianensis]KAI6240337.1 COP9 signalosome complex subunit 4 [Aphelenchoides fujianensis]
MSVEQQVKDAEALEAAGSLREALAVLVNVSFESTQRTFSDELKMEVYLKAADLFVKLDDIPGAEQQVTRASMLQTSVQDDDLLTKYKASLPFDCSCSCCSLQSLYAVVLDRNSRFAEAATRWHELSYKPQLTPGEKQEVLQHALTCTLLAPPGTPKNRMLKNVFKDERCHQLVGYSVIKAMFLERLIKPAELTNFEAVLRPHQRQVDSDGTSTLQRAVLEHNILAASRLYKNITFDSLSQLLGISADQAERTIGRLITTNCLAATVDQLENIVLFDEGSPNDQWNAYVLSVCDQTNRVSELLAKKHAEWHGERVKAISANAATSAATV